MRLILLAQGPSSENHGSGIYEVSQGKWRPLEPTGEEEEAGKSWPGAKSVQLPADLGLTLLVPGDTSQDSSGSSWLQLCSGKNHLLFITVHSWLHLEHNHFPFYF